MRKKKHSRFYCRDIDRNTTKNPRTYPLFQLPASNLFQIFFQFVQTALYFVQVEVFHLEYDQHQLEVTKANVHQELGELSLLDHTQSESVFPNISVGKSPNHEACRYLPASRQPLQ